MAVPQGEGYWAQVLKEKAVLQLELEKVKSDLDQSVLEIVDLKKQNSDVQLEIKTIQNEKEEIVRKIKYGEDLANNLAVEVARARNDQKMTNERADKLKNETQQLQEQIKQLTTTKVALERSLTRLGEGNEAQEHDEDAEDAHRGEGLAMPPLDAQVLGHAARVAAAGRVRPARAGR